MDDFEEIQKARKQMLEKRGFSNIKYLSVTPAMAMEGKNMVVAGDRETTPPPTKETTEETKDDNDDNKKDIVLQQRRLEYKPEPETENVDLGDFNKIIEESQRTREELKKEGFSIKRAGEMIGRILGKNLYDDVGLGFKEANTLPKKIFNSVLKSASLKTLGIIAAAAGLTVSTGASGLALGSSLGLKIGYGALLGAGANLLSIATYKANKEKKNILNLINKELEEVKQLKDEKERFAKLNDLKGFIDSYSHILKDKFSTTDSIVETKEYSKLSEKLESLRKSAEINLADIDKDFADRFSSIKEKMEAEVVVDNNEVVFSGTKKVLFGSALGLIGGTIGAHISESYGSDNPPKPKAEKSEIINDKITLTPEQKDTILPDLTMEVPEVTEFPTIVTVQKGDTLSELLDCHLQTIPGDQKDILHKLFDLANRQGNTGQLEDLRQFGINSCNVNLIHPGDKINLTGLIEYLDTECSIESSSFTPQPIETITKPQVVEAIATPQPTQIECDLLQGFSSPINPLLDRATEYTYENGLSRVEISKILQGDTLTDFINHIENDGSIPENYKNEAITNLFNNIFGLSGKDTEVTFDIEKMQEVLNNKLFSIDDINTMVGLKEHSGPEEYKILINDIFNETRFEYTNSQNNVIDELNKVIQDSITDKNVRNLGNSHDLILRDVFYLNSEKLNEIRKLVNFNVYIDFLQSVDKKLNIKG